MRAIMLVFPVFLFTILGYETASATVCKPLSRFKVDCNTCFCSREGSRYACTRKLCKGEPSEFQFLNDEGYDDFVLPKEKENKIPYINDEIPPSKEDWNDLLLDEVHPEDYILPGAGAADDPRFVQPQQIEEVGLDDQDAEDFGGLPEDYRFKREILI